MGPWGRWRWPPTGTGPPVFPHTVTPLVPPPGHRLEFLVSAPGCSAQTPHLGFAKPVVLVSVSVTFNTSCCHLPLQSTTRSAPCWSCPPILLSPHPTLTIINPKPRNELILLKLGLFIVRGRWQPSGRPGQRQWMVAVATLAVTHGGPAPAVPGSSVAGHTDTTTGSPTGPLTPAFSAD